MSHDQVFAQANWMRRMRDVALGDKDQKLRVARREAGVLAAEVRQDAKEFLGKVAFAITCEVVPDRSRNCDVARLSVTAVATAEAMRIFIREPTQLMQQVQSVYWEWCSGGYSSKSTGVGAVKWGQWLVGAPLAPLVLIRNMPGHSYTSFTDKQRWVVQDHCGSAKPDIVATKHVGSRGLEVVVAAAFPEGLTLDHLMPDQGCEGLTEEAYYKRMARSYPQIAEYLSRR